MRLTDDELDYAANGPQRAGSLAADRITRQMARELLNLRQGIRDTSSARCGPEYRDRGLHSPDCLLWMIDEEHDEVDP